MTKYREYVKKMYEENEEAFSEFEAIHNFYGLEKQKYQDEFNRVGEQIMELVQEYENKLCGHSEKGQYANFSAGLAGKFQEEVRKRFPLLDFIGVEVIVEGDETAQEIEDEFDDLIGGMKKISLS